MGGRHGRLAGTALLVAALGACAADVPGDPVAPGEAGLELGTGQTAFEPLADGDAADVYMGLQGGMHFFGSVRVHGISPGDRTRPRNADYQPTTRFVVTRGAETLAEVEQTLPLTAIEGGGHELVGVVLRLFLPEVDPPSPSDVAGQSLLLEASVMDNDTNMATATVRLVGREGL